MLSWSCCSSLLAARLKHRGHSFQPRVQMEWYTPQHAPHWKSDTSVPYRYIWIRPVHIKDNPDEFINKSINCNSFILYLIIPSKSSTAILLSLLQSFLFTFCQTGNWCDMPEMYFHVNVYTLWHIVIMKNLCASWSTESTLEFQTESRTAYHLKWHCIFRNLSFHQVSFH